MNNTIVGVDLAKKVIQVCVVKRHKVLLNEAMSASEFSLWLATQSSVVIVFEACSMSNYWKQKAQEHGHIARLISTRLVAAVRQQQKTDKNDALAIAQAAQLPEVQFISGKTFEQQELQTILRMRELGVKQKVALGNQIRALLAEFNITASPAQGGLSRAVQDTLETADNGFSMIFREALHLTWQAYLAIIERIQHYDQQLAKVIKQHPDCQRLMALEGVSVINAINLFNLLKLGDDVSFRSGREAAACVGLTPIQHSSGGKAVLGSIGKHIRNQLVRSQLISGAMAVVGALSRRSAKSQKEVWLKNLIERRGKRCAAVALANKTVRTAFALLRDGSEYQAQAVTA